jgi:hypothetical protein
VTGDGLAGRRGTLPAGQFGRQRFGVGVEPETDLATALLDERREPIREGL